MKDHSMNSKSMSTSADFAVFTAAIVRKLQEKAGDACQILSGNVKKNNGIELTGIIIEEKNCNTSPTIYIDDFFEDYQRGSSLQEIAETIWQIYCQNRFEESVNLSNFIKYENAKGQIAFRLVNYEKNRELLKEVPHKRFCNLAVIFYYSVMEPPFFGRASILIYGEHLKNWKINPEELYKAAVENTPRLFPARIENIENVMMEILEKGVSQNERKEMEQEWIDDLLIQLEQDFQREESRIPMYVLSNPQKLYGAACMLYSGVMEKFSRKIDNDFYILPSSVHEVILLPFSGNTSDAALLEMVTEINRTQVEESEILADSVYCFLRSDNRIHQLR